MHRQRSSRAKSLDGPWATVAVLAEKLPQKQSSAGKSYTLWRLSDLTNAGRQVTPGVHLSECSILGSHCHWHPVRNTDHPPCGVSLTSHAPVTQL